MQQYGIAQEIEAADRAINAQDFDKVAACYTEDAALVVRPGSIARGRDNIERSFVRISEYFNGSLKVSQGDMVIIEAGDTALVLAKTSIESPGKPDSEFPSQRDAIYVYRKDESGKWLCAIDNSYGFELLQSKPE